MASGGGVGGGADLGLAFLRLAGVGLAYHAYQKLAGGNMPGMTTAVGDMGLPVPAFFAWIATISVLVGGALVAVGLFTRAGAGIAAVTIFVVAFVAQAKDGFERRELALLYLVILLCLACLGPGKWSVDGVVRKKV